MGFLRRVTHNGLNGAFNRAVGYAVAIPIFERVDAELTAARAEIEARRINDPIAKARALAQARKAG